MRHLDRNAVNERRESLIRQLEIYYKNLSYVEEQKAKMGLDVPFKIEYGLAEIKQEIESILNELDGIVNQLNLPNSNIKVSRSQVVLEFEGDLSHVSHERRDLAVEAARGALAGGLGISHEQIYIREIELGSLILYLEMPTFAVNRLVTLYEIQAPLIVGLGIFSVSQIPLSEAESLGLVSTSLSSESTQDEFFFWIDYRYLVEATQLVRVTMPLPIGHSLIKKLKKDAITVIGIVEEVRRQSESRSLGSDYARYDGQVENNPLLPPTGFTYAHCRVLDIDPLLFVPLTEGLPVYLANEEEAGRGYNYPDMETAKTDLTVGLLRNGGTEVAGAAKLDTRYMLGEFGGHVNVTGVAGTGTKTSFLMVLVKMLRVHAEAITLENATHPLYVVPVVFNVKGNDLMWLNQPNKNFNVESPDWDIYREVWGDGLFNKFAQPFKEAKFYSYPTKNKTLKSGLPPGTQKYSWGLKDVIEWGVEKYLFSDESRSHELMQGVLEDAFQYISKSSPNHPSGRTLNNSNEGNVKDFNSLVVWMSKATAKSDDDQLAHYLITRQHDGRTIKATARRLNNILIAARGVLERDSASGEPPEITSDKSSDPIVIDIDGLEPAPQRFVVASTIEKLKQHREKHAERRQRYLIVLDELNRFAPKGSSDEVSKLFEHVAAQLRSQGIILFGAQQKASSISPLVWENASTKALGRTGAVELAADMWRQVLPAATRTRAANLGSSEKIILQDSFNYPMLANIPFTPWATRKDEIGITSTGNGNNILSSLDFGDDE
jgi:hypothetical protein